MKKIRINELARELEVKAHEVLDKLPELGVHDKKTHSSSIDDDVADELRVAFGHEPLGPSEGPAEADYGDDGDAPSMDGTDAAPAASEPKVAAVAPPPAEVIEPAAPVEAKTETESVRPAGPAHPIRPPLAGHTPAPAMPQPPRP